MPFNFDSQGHAYIARRTSSCGDVTIQRVIHHHPISVESPAQCPYRPLHALDPATRKTIAVALIVKGNHLVTQGSVQVLRVPGVVHLYIRVSPPTPDGEPVESVIRLRPPAIQHRKVQAAVQDDFLTACSRRLKGPPRIIQPDIDPLDKVSSYIDVVVLHEHKFVGKLGVTHQS